MFRRRTSSDNDARILIANSLVDIDPDYAVSASDLPNRGTGGSGYDLDTNVGTAANRKIHPSGSCLLFGASGDYVSTPDSAAASITGDIDIRLDMALDDWTPAGTQYPLSKQITSGQYSYDIEIRPTGVINFRWSANGTAVNDAISTAAPSFSDGERGRIRITMDVDNGAGGYDVTFYTSTDGVTWSQLGNVITGGATTSIHDGSDTLSIGAQPNGSAPISGIVYSAQIYNGINGTLAVDFDPTKYVSGTTFNTTMSDELVTSGGFDADSDWTIGSGWTISGGAASFDGVGTDTISQNLGLVTGVTYLVSYDITAISGSVYVVLGGDAAGTVRSSTGSYTDVVVSGTNAIFYVQPQTGTCTIDNISVVKITPWTLNGNTFIQNTGHDVLHSIGSNGLETAAGQSITGPSTVFMVGAAAAASFAGSRFFFDARSNASARRIIYTDDSASDKYTLFQGANVTLDEALDADPHVFTAQFNGDATSKLTVSGVGSKTGNAGAQSWDFGRIFDSVSGGSGMEGYIARLLVFDYALSETQVSAIQNYLSAYYGGI